MEKIYSDISALLVVHGIAIKENSVNNIVVLTTF